MVKKYPDRNIYRYPIVKRTMRTREFWMNCSCGSRIKDTSPDTTINCPKCGREITDYDTVYSDGEHRTLYNRGTTIFIDDDVLTVSFFVVGVEKMPNLVPLIHHKGSINLKVRFNKTTRTSVMYTTNPKRMDRWQIERFRGKGKFKNFTQPTFNHFNSVDIKLPPEFITDFLDFMEIESVDRDLSLIDLAWINRTRKTGRDMKREREVLQIIEDKRKDLFLDIENKVRMLSDYIPQEYLYENNVEAKKIEGITYDVKINEKELRNIVTGLEKLNNDDNYPRFNAEIKKILSKYERYLLTRKNAGRIKRYVKTDHKIKNYDKLIFDGLCASYKEDFSELSDRIKAAYYDNPWSMSKHRELSELFTREHLLEKAINSVFGFNDDYPYYDSISIKREDYLYAFSLKARKANNIECLTDRNISDIENKVYRLLISRKSEMGFDNAYSTLSAIIKLTKTLINKGVHFTVPNDLKEAHEELSRLVRLNSDAKITYDNKYPEERIVYGKEVYFIKKVATSLDFIKKDGEMNSYSSGYNWIRDKYHGVYELKKNNKTLAIFLIGELHSGGETVKDVRRNKNIALTERMQKVIVDYTERHKIDISFQSIQYVSDKKRAKIIATQIAA